MNELSQALTTSVASPTTDATAPSGQPGADATAASSTASHDASAESSPAGGAKPRTLSDAISKALGPLEEDGESAATESPAEAEAGSEAKSDEVSGGKKDEPAAAEKKDDQTLDESSLKGKARERIEQLAREVKQYKPVVEELKKLTGDERGFQNMLSLVRNHAENPAEAVPMLEMLLQDARERAGLVVKSADVRQKLDDGLIDEPTALELEQARVAKTRSQQEREAREAQRVQQAMQAQVTALDQWEKNIKERNPDFESLSDRVRDRFISLATQQRPESPEEATALAQQAYDDVTGWVQKRIPAKAPQKVATSSGSSTKQAGARPRSIQEIVNRTL